MRVITSFFSIESLQSVLGHPIEGELDDSAPAIVKDAVNAHRDWLGLQEGENRIEVMEKPMVRCKPTHGRAQVKVLFTFSLIQ